MAELGIADLLRDGDRSVKDLAAVTGTTVEPLYRVLRALASIGVFDEHDPRRFSLTPIGEFLRTDADVWEYRRAHPRDGEVFDAAMRTLAAADVQARISVYDFGRHRVIADIGGGTGANLASILAVVPQARGILFDQPHVVAGAGSVLAATDVADRVEVAAGSFFESVPAGADLYLNAGPLAARPSPAASVGSPRRCRVSQRRSERRSATDCSCSC